jgi:hypothetical protein
LRLAARQRHKRPTYGCAPRTASELGCMVSGQCSVNFLHSGIFWGWFPLLATKYSFWALESLWIFAKESCKRACRQCEKASQGTVVLRKQSVWHPGRISSCVQSPRRKVTDTSPARQGRSRAVGQECFPSCGEAGCRAAAIGARSAVHYNGVSKPLPQRGDCDGRST